MGTVSHDSSSFTWTGSETSGNFADGPAWIHKPAANGSASVSEPTPAQTTNLGGVVHGAELNPLGPLVDKQGYCEHSTDYDAARTQTSWPVSMSAGDVLVKAVSRTDASGSVGEVSSWDNGLRRMGVNIETNALCVVENLPDAETFAPPVAVGGGAVPFKQTRYADLDACVAAAPSYDTSAFSAHVPTFTEAFTNGIDKFAYGYGQNGGATTGSGYQSALPFTLYDSGSNYGQNAARYWGACALLYISNAITAAQKKQILIRMISAGAQWHEGCKARSFVNGGNGAHHQFGFIPMMFYLYYTQKNFDDMLTFTPCHQLAQSFFITQSHMDNELTYFHSNSAWSSSTKARTVSAINGNLISFSTATGGDDANQRYGGCIMVRQSDGARIQTVDGGNTSSGVVEIASQPSPSLAINDVICFDHDISGGFAVGQGHWGIGTSQKVKNWGSFVIGTDASYRNLQFWAEGLTICQAMGWTGFNGYDGFKAYVEACNATSPAVPDTYPWDDHHQNIAGKDFSENFWNTHYSSMSGGPPALPVLPAGSVAATVTVP
jgi:predicted heme/steroid binding protein